MARAKSAEYAEYAVMAMTSTGTIHMVNGDWDKVLTEAATYKMARLFNSPLPVFPSVKIYMRFANKGQSEVRHIEMSMSGEKIDAKIAALKASGVREVIWG